MVFLKNLLIKNKSISIRMSMILVFVVMMITTVSIVGFIVFNNWLHLTRETIHIMSDDMNKEIYQKIDGFLNNPISITEMNSNLIEKGIIDIDNEIEREKFFVGVLQKHLNNSVYSFSIGLEKGQYYGARRNDSDQIEIMRNNDETNGHSWYYSVTEQMTAGERVVVTGVFDARTRDWYKAAKENNKLVFSPIYKHFVMDDLTVSISAPIYDQEGILYGILGTHVTLSNINDVLEEIVTDKQSIAVIVERDTGYLIGNSLGIQNYKTLENGKFDRLSIEDINNDCLKRAFDYYKSNGNRFFINKNNKEKDQINIIEYQNKDLDWIIITSIPESLFLTNIKNNMLLALVLIIIAIAISIVIYMALTYKYLRPIDVLIATTKKFSAGDLSQRVPIVRDDEIGKISVAFNQMANTICMYVNHLENKVQERTAELVEANQQFKYLFENSPVMKAIVKDNRCLQINKAWLDNTGYCKDEVIGHDVRELPILKELTLCKDSASSFLMPANGKHLQLSYTTKKAGKRVVLVNYIKLEQSHDEQCLVVAIDITKLHQYEQELAKLDRLHTVGQVASAIAHEVRNPLTVVKGFTQFFSMKPEFSQYKDQMTLIVNEIDRANQIISDFLSLAKTNNYVVEYTSINDEINEILPLIFAHALKNNIQIESDLKQVPKTNICKNEFRQVILNIVNNAIDVSKDGDTVTISTDVKDNYIVVSIADEGGGIPESVQENIGELFFTTKEHGTGIGLTICNTILQRHNGFMTFDTSSSGTTFYLHFPITE